MKPEIIITARGHAGTMATLQAEFASHLLSEAPDRAGFLKQHAARRCAALATFGPMPVDGKLMDALPKLEIISNFGVGVDAINLDDAKKRNIIVTNTPDVLNECVADTALALILNTRAQVPAVGGLPSRPATGRRAALIRSPPRLGGKMLGILGLGRIGEAIAERAAGVRHEDPLPQPQQKDVPLSRTTRIP